ncbi:hypothetical protein [uncultured Nostoc sp.]|uniref:hypothetical protein n=1 Tax=uncultured Nostoc sp. TaxID=340711 RepID=UPI0035CAE6D9
MSRLMSLSLEESVLQSQWTDLIKLHRQKLERAPKIIELAKLTTQKLEVLQCLAITGESSARAIALTIHRSRSTVTKELRELSSLKYANYREVSAGVGAVKPRHLYYLAHDFSSDTINAAIKYKSQKSFKLPNSVAENLLESVLSDTDLKNDVTEQRDLFFFHLRHLALELSPTVQSILKLIPDAGIRSAEIAHILGFDNTTVNKHLKYLVESGWLCRQVSNTKTQGRSGYAYFPVAGINTELIQFLLEGSDQASNGTLIQLQNGHYDYDNVSQLVSSNTGTIPGDIQLTSPGKLMSENHFKDNLDDSNANIFMKSEATQQKATAPSASSENNLLMAGEIMSKIKELLVLRREVSIIKRKVSIIHKELRDLGGKDAEELIAELESEKF